MNEELEKYNTLQSEQWEKVTEFLSWANVSKISIMLF